jgi:hypothetical protein
MPFLRVSRHHEMTSVRGPRNDCFTRVIDPCLSEREAHFPITRVDCEGCAAFASVYERRAERLERFV